MAYIPNIKSSPKRERPINPNLKTSPRRREMLKKNPKIINTMYHYEPPVLNKEAKITDNEISFPIKKTYYLNALVEEIVDNKLSPYSCTYSNYRGWDKHSFSMKEFHNASPELAISAFLLEVTNDNVIRALFEKPEIVKFTLIENTTTSYTEDEHPTVISNLEIKTDDDLKKELLADPRFKEVYDEIVREKTKFERKIQEEEKDRERDKRENYYHQWKWLENKRLNGEFDDFLDFIPKEDLTTF